MPNAIGPTGLTIATDAELVAAFTAAMQLIYGSDINLASDTPDGQMMNIFIQAVLDVEDLLLQINNMFDPDNAIGVILDQRVAINGIQRQAGTFTVTNVTLVTSQSVNLYGLDQSAQPVYTVADNAGHQWQLQSTQLGLSAGTTVLAFQASTPGANLTVPNTITVPVTIVLGVTSINNPTTYTSLGIDEESDAVLKVRRSKSVSLSSQGYLAGLLAALENIPGITSAFVYENVTGTTNVDGVPGHSIWVIVAGTPTVLASPAWDPTISYNYGAIVSSGGVDYISWRNNNLNNLVSNPAFWGVYNPVAQAIYNKRNAAAGMFGATTYSITQIDGSVFVIFWDVVSLESIFTAFTVASLDGINPPDIAAIRAKLASNSGFAGNYTPGVAEEVNVNRLSTLVQLIDSNTLVTFTSFGTPAVGGFATVVGGPYTNTLSTSAKNKQITLSSANIIILPMILSPFNPLSGTPVVVPSLGTKQFTGLGGFGGLVYTFDTNNSGGSISGAGLYTAGATPSVQDTIRVTDSLGNFALALIAVT